METVEIGFMKVSHLRPRFCEKRQTTIHKPAVVVVPADPNLFLASGRKQLLDKLAAAKSDKTSDCALIVALMCAYVYYR